MTSRKPQAVARREAHAARFVVNPGTLYVFADGSSSKKEDCGGWGSVLYFNGHTKFACGGGPNETNNTMELTAILMGLRMVKARDKHPVHICSDSRYALDCIFRYSATWRKNNWRTSAGEAVKNRNLIETLLDEVATFKTIRPHWVPGHNGIKYNELADRLAGRGRDLFGKFRGSQEDEILRQDMKWSEGWMDV